MTAWHEKTKSSLPAEANEIISKFLARKKMQDKYINQVRKAGEQGDGWVSAVGIAPRSLCSLAPVKSSYGQGRTGRKKHQLTIRIRIPVSICFSGF